MVSLASAMPLSFGKISCRISSGGRSSSCKVAPAMTGLGLEGSWEVLWLGKLPGVADYPMTRTVVWNSTVVRFYNRVSPVKVHGDPRGSCRERGHLPNKVGISIMQFRDSASCRFGSSGCGVQMP